jgi:hypothetical protein
LHDHLGRGRGRKNAASQEAGGKQHSTHGAPQNF